MVDLEGHVEVVVVQARTDSSRRVDDSAASEVQVKQACAELDWRRSGSKCCIHFKVQ